MTLTTNQALIIILMVALATIITRFLPFILFSSKGENLYINYLGNVLPYAAIGLLVVYCLKTVNIRNSPHGAPELICVLITALLHLWKKNTLLSIGLGTALYMFSVQYIFI